MSNRDDDRFVLWLITIVGILMLAFMVGTLVAAWRLDTRDQRHDPPPAEATP